LKTSSFAQGLPQGHPLVHILQEKKEKTMTKSQTV
jgi:hypothetical protein